MIQKKYIAPNLITAGNMFLGYLSIIESMKFNFLRAITFIILAMICDGLDGKTARKLDAYSEFGKEFDSFSDAISFGLAPSIFAYCLLNFYDMSSVAMPIAFLYALFGVMRLVKFNVINVASSEKGDFSGMPIPNAAGLVISYFLICYYIEQYFKINLFNINIFIGITVISATLMVSKIPFKTPDKTFSFIPHKMAMPFIIISLICIIFSLFILTMLYALINLANYFNNRFKNNKDDEDEIEYIEENDLERGNNE